MLNLIHNLADQSHKDAIYNRLNRYSVCIATHPSPSTTYKFEFFKVKHVKYSDKRKCLNRYNKHSIEILTIYINKILSLRWIEFKSVLK